MRIRLVTRYTVLTSLLLIVVMSVSAYLHINKVQKIFLEKSIHDADTISQVVLHDSHQLMLDDNRQHLQLMIEHVGRTDRIQHARIVGRRGHIAFSTDHDEIGNTLSTTDQTCSFCHLNDKEVLEDVPVVDRSRIFDKQGIKFLSTTRGIYNEPSCYTAACHVHSADEKKLGVLNMVVSLDQMEELAEAHHTDVILSSGVMIYFLSMFFFFMTKRYICNPIDSLLEQSQELAGGNLGARVRKTSSDELGDLGSSFNNMADNLAQAQIELQDWANTLEQKVEQRTAEITDMQSQLVRSAKLASMGELVAGVAHEINNPLTGILMFASLSAKTPDLPQQVQDNLELIVSETGRCAKIVRGLLEFARESFPEKKPESVNKIIKHTLELVSQQALFQDIDIQCNCDETLPEIEIDADQLQQVFLNMFINAGQAMSGGGQLTISTLLIVDGRVVQITVEDSGTGISAENLDKVFDPFFSTKSQQGFGLGLSVSYGIIKNHGGRVDVTSRIGEGTCFTILLPVSADESLPEAESDQETS